MIVKAVSEKCQACHCVTTEFRLVWEHWCANAEVFQNPTLLIWYFKDTLTISTAISGQWFNAVKVVLSLSVLCNLEWGHGPGDREPDWVVCFVEGPSYPPLLVRLQLKVCFTPAWPCSRCLHHAQRTCGAPHPQSCPLGNSSNMLWECFGKRGLYEYVERAWLVQFGFATSKCHRAELPRAWGQGGDGAAGEGFAWIFLDW